MYWRTSCHFIIYSLLVLCSCATLKPGKRTSDQIALDRNNLSRLSGQYTRGSANDESSDLFWDFFLESPVGDKVALKVMDEKRIRVTLLSGSDTLKTRVLRGELIDGSFLFKRRIKVYPFILGNIVKNGKIRIGLTADDNLIVDSRSILYGHLLFFPATEGFRKSGGIHVRLDNRI